MRRGDFNVNGFVGSTNGAVITNWFDTGIPARKNTLNDSAVGLDRAILFDDGNYSNREFEFEFSIRADTEAQRKSRYVAFMTALDTGKYVPATFYFDDQYQYQIVRTDVIDITRPLVFSSTRIYKVKVSAAPYKYLLNVKNVSGTSVTLINPEAYYAKPHFIIKGTGAINLTVNGAVTKLTNVVNSIELDSALQTVWKVDNTTIVNENAKMAIGAFPLLKPGTNTISVNSGTVEIEPRWRTL